MDKSLAISNRVKAARQKAKLTQSQLCRLIKCTESTVQRLERGSHLPSAEFIVRICKALNISADYLLGIRIRIKNEEIEENEA